MNAQILDGAQCSKIILGEIFERVKRLQKTPQLRVIMVGDDPRSVVYVQNKVKAATAAGINCQVISCPADVDTEGLLKVIRDQNNNSSVDAFIVQLPLPKDIDLGTVSIAIDPRKDVDCFHPVNQGLLLLGTPRFIPATPAGVIELLKRNNITTQGKRVVIVGHSTIVGRPLAAALLCKGEMGDATVTVAHKETKNLQQVCREAEILIVAIGKPGFFTTEYVSPGTIVVDVGISKVDGKIVGDVDFENVKSIASSITPVPGGVGPMTVAMLLSNTVQLCEE